MVPHSHTHTQTRTHTQTHTQDLTVLSSLGAKQIRFGARARSCCLQVATTSSFSTHTAFTRPVSSHVTTRMVFPLFFLFLFFPDSYFPLLVVCATFLFRWCAKCSLWCRKHTVPRHTTCRIVGFANAVAGSVGAFCQVLVG